jgi:phosphomannomutase
MTGATGVSEPIISVSGLRGIIGESLTPEVALRYAAAFAQPLTGRSIVITRDGRATGPMLAAVLKGTLSALGCEVIDADVAATPTTGVLVRQLGAAGGIQISASHNPPQYNGLKLFSPEGRVITAVAGEDVIKRYRGGSAIWADFDHLGAIKTCADAIGRHLQLVLATVDVERIRSKRYKVLLDSNHGAGSVLGVRLLEALGCEVTALGDSPDGLFAHTPEPTAENLAGVLSAVSANGCDVGFCQDPDADRLALIDAGGRYVGEEYTLAICIDHRLRQQRGPIVTNCSTSRMSEDLAAKYGVPFFRSAVGEANVVDRMLTEGAVIGGEGNGGAIDPRVVLVRDSFVGMAQTLDAMASRNRTLAQLIADLPRYEIEKTKLTLPREKMAAAFDAVEKHFADAKVDRLDGLRLDWPGKWLLVRASNTEPIVRAVAEAPTAAEAARLCAEATAAMSAI